MNAAQLRELGFDEAADAAEAQQWQGEKARVFASHRAKNPEEREGWFTREDVDDAEREQADAQMCRFRDWQHGERGAGCAGNSADEYDSSTEGHW